MRLPKTRRESQSGATLVELLVSVVVIGIALALIVGTLSSGLLQSTVAKRDTASTTVIQYEMDVIGSSPFNAGAQAYSDCFATENASSLPAPTVGGYRGPCPDTTYTLRADVSISAGPGGAQQWTIAVFSWPTLAPAGPAVSILKVNR